MSKFHSLSLKTVFRYVAENFAFSGAMEKKAIEEKRGWVFDEVAYFEVSCVKKSGF